MLSRTYTVNHLSNDDLTTRLHAPPISFQRGKSATLVPSSASPNTNCGEACLDPAFPSMSDLEWNAPLCVGRIWTQELVVLASNGGKYVQRVQ
jgi:hypothetical protein